MVKVHIGSMYMCSLCMVMMHVRYMWCMVTSGDMLECMRLQDLFAIKADMGSCGAHERRTRCI